MFNKSEERHRRRGPSLPFILLRMCLSLTMLSIFGLMIFQAYKHFSGVDPLSIDPAASAKTTIISLLTSDSAAKLVKDLLSLNIKEVVKNPGLTEIIQPADKPADKPITKGPLLLRFAIVSDSHNDNAKLQKALIQAKTNQAKFVIGLGDYSDTGTLGELQQAKNQFDGAQLPYYLTIGDHDMWDCRNREQVSTCNYSQLFGSSYQSFEVSGVRFLILDNADNYLGVDGVAMSWLEEELSRIKAGKPKLIFALMQEPLYHPSSDHFMGKTTPSLVPQAQKIADLLKNAGVAEVITGDVHFFTQYTDPRTSLKMTTVGAVSEARNTQSPRFVLVDVYEGGTYNIQDLEIK